MNHFDAGWVRQWYRDHLGIWLPDTEFIDVPPELEMPDMRATMIVPPVLAWEEIDHATWNKTRKKALHLLHNDADFSSFPSKTLRRAFDECVEADIERYRQNVEQRKALRDYFAQHRGFRIYILARFKELQETDLGEGAEEFLNSLVAHEFMHIEQDRRDLVRGYLNMREGPAWLCQFLYGIQQLGKEEYERLVERTSVAGALSERELNYANRANTGVQVIVETLRLSESRDIRGKLERFRTVFRRPRYDEMGAQIFYREAKPKVLEKLRAA